MIKINIKIDIRSVEKDLKRILAERKLKASVELLNSLKGATPIDTGAARDAWKIEQHGNKTIISNDKDYISELNMGSSVQAPSHFIERTVLEQKNVKPDGTIVTYT